MVCTTVLHGGVCHRSSTPHKSGNKMKEKKEYIRHPTRFLHSIRFMSSHGACTCHNGAAILIVYLIAILFTYGMFIAEELTDQLWWYCAGLSTSMKFGTDVDQNILNSFFAGAKAGGAWGRHNGKKQHGCQSLFDCVITL